MIFLTIDILLNQGLNTYRKNKLIIRGVLKFISLKNYDNTLLLNFKVFIKSF